MFHPILKYGTGILYFLEQLPLQYFIPGQKVHFRQEQRAKERKKAKKREKKTKQRQHLKKKELKVNWIEYLFGIYRSIIIFTGADVNTNSCFVFRMMRTRWFSKVWTGKKEAGPRTTGIFLSNNMKKCKRLVRIWPDIRLAGYPITREAG